MKEAGGHVEGVSLEEDLAPSPGGLGWPYRNSDEGLEGRDGDNAEQSPFTAAGLLNTGLQETSRPLLVDLAKAPRDCSWPLMLG